MTDRSTVLLEHHLKELKLPTFLREYGKVAGQCAAEGVDHPGYLMDRLAHRVHILELNGESYRLKQSRQTATTRAAGDSPDA